MKITTSLPRIIIPSCIGVMMCASALASGTAPEYYTDYPSKIENVTAQLRGYINEHPERTTDSMMNHVLDDINNGKIASVKTLASYVKRNSPQKISTTCAAKAHSCSVKWST